MLWLLIIFSLIFAFLNGLRDSSSIMVGVIASRALRPRHARIMSGIAELVAPFIFGQAVAQTLMNSLVDPEVITLGTLTGAMAATLGWTMFAMLRGIPSSSSHALVGGMLGAALVTGGPEAIVTGGLYKVLIPLFLAPIIGLGAGYLMTNFIYIAAENATPRVNNIFQRLQIGTMLGLSVAHSANDAQKSMGIITLGMYLAGMLPTTEVPIQVVALCAVAIALGAARGDWRLMRTLGRKIYTIRPINALASQASSGIVILSSAILGAPVSTSQVISMALLGAGAAERANKVRWQVGFEMLITWLLTIPAAMLLAAVLVKVISLVHP